ncbi:MAG: murein biosynthesis integral membrane protein MurJ [Clostridiales bacterium]|jgi:putative peptidoglycan lipid II flippase|nr:murein biosynthesis integral membrane protein MurJ [Clostridiales bacterium]
MKIPKAIRTIGFITAAIFASKLAGMARDILFANFYGASELTDAYLAAARIPLLFFDLTLGAAVLSAFIPVFNELLTSSDGDEAKSKAAAFKFASNFFNTVLVISTVFTCAGMIFARPIIGLFAPGLTASGLNLGAILLIIMLPTMIFTALAYVFAGVLQSLGEFNVPALISLISNIAVIIYLLAFNGRFGIYGMAAAILLGWGLQVAVQIPSLIKHKFRYTLTLNLRDPSLRASAKMAIPILISAWVQPICVAINTRFASYLDAGAISALDYANKIYIMIVGIFSFAITNYIFPKLSQLSALGAEGAAKRGKLLRQSIGGLSVIIIPIMLAMIFFAHPLIKLVYGRGAFTADNINAAAAALFGYSFGMLALGINEILNKAFYAEKDGKTPMLSSIAGIALNIATVLWLQSAGRLSIVTLALAQAVSSNVIMLFLIIKIRKKSRDNVPVIPPS